MATIKSYTDLNQSRKLAEVLPHDTADGTWKRVVIAGINLNVPEEQQYIHDGGIPFMYYSGIGIPSWSLAALLDILQKTAYFIDEDANVTLCSYKTVEWNLGINNSDVEFTTKTNPVDACYEMIIKLHKQKLL